MLGKETEEKDKVFQISLRLPTSTVEALRALADKRGLGSPEEAAAELLTDWSGLVDEEYRRATILYKFPGGGTLEEDVGNILNPKVFDKKTAPVIFNLLDVDNNETSNS